MVIYLTNYPSELFLITSFSVDNNEKAKYKKWLDDYRQKKPHLVSEARILRQYEWSEQVTCLVLFPLGIDSANVTH